MVYKIIEKGVRQLFLDDYLVERAEGLRRVVNQPGKHPENPVVSPDKPWIDTRLQPINAFNRKQSLCSDEVER